MQLGTQLFTGPGGYHNFLGRTTTGQQAAPIFDQEQIKFTDYLNVFLFDMKRQLGLDIQALQSKNLFQTLAEPNLVAESGKEASFLAGGEFPVPIAQPSGGAVAITIVFKEFGVRLNFTPVVNGDRVHLKVRPEVSTLDFANGVQLQGFRIPALSTRRAETELELMNGQTFAIAGLLDNSVTQSLQKIPGIGDIPILGELFKSRSAQKDRTELVVMITPEILPRNSPGVTTELPRGPEQFLPQLPAKKLQPTPPPAFKSSGDMSATMPAQPTATPANAAAAVTALTPTARPVLHEAVPAPVPSHPIQVTAEPANRMEAPRPQETVTPAQPIVAQEPPMDPKAKAAADKKAAKLAKAQAEHDRELAKKQAELDRKQAEKDAELAKKQAEAAKKQAAKDAEAAKKQAEKDAEAAKKQNDASKKQADVDKQQQKAVADAAARLKAAQEAYDAEIAKKRDPKNEQSR
jgi:hypothetical protein